jgi:VWFA-related protein
MRIRIAACLSVLVVAMTAGLWGQTAQSAPPAQTPPPAPQGPKVTFHGAVNLILVDVTVRDKKGDPVEGLSQNDFEVLENGKVQEIVNFKYEKVAATNTVLTSKDTLSKAGEAKGAVAVTLGLAPKVGPKPAAPAPAPAPKVDESAPKAPVDADTGPLTSDEVAGHRVWILLFDTSSMQPEDVQKAADGAIKWSKEKMSPSDLVAVAVISSTLQIVQDFTNDKAKIAKTLQAFAVTDGTAVGVVDASTMTTDEATNAATAADTTTVDNSAAELDTFNVDMRLRALKTICDSVASIQQHKAILYFTSGMTRSSDNAVEARAAENSCSRANTSLNPVDSRGLQAIVAGGSARQGSRGGVNAFSGRGVAQQFSAQAASQESLQTLAANTGGTAFTDSNDFGEAFDKVEKDISAYYILGYASSNSKQDGTFRKIEVRLKTKVDAKIKAREGYYAPSDFANTKKADRETQLQEQLLMAIPATDVPLFVASGYFRLPESEVGLCGQQFGMGGGPGGPGGGRGGGAGGQGRPGGPGGPAAAMFTPSCYYVPISVTVPGEAVPVSATNEMLDVRGFICDERLQVFATIKSTITVPPSAKGTISSKQILFQTGATLPPGRYTAKVIVRENTTGQMGTYETPIVVPDLNRQQQVKVSTVVLSTQLLSAVGHAKTASPLVRDNIEIVPNLTRVVNQDQKLYFYYEVYDPTLSESAPQIRTSLSFYRKGTKVYETPMVERTEIDAPTKKAQVYQFEVDADKFKPGVYTCQVTVIDEVSGKFGFQRFDMAVRPSEKAAGAGK